MSSLTETASVEIEAKKTVLLAEDNDANRLIAKSVLERDGYKVIAKSNGKSALRYFKKKHCDIIILDILMPVMDGFKTQRRIREMEIPGETIPIFALTAYCSPADQTRYRLAGFSGIMAKPLRSGQLKDMIARYNEGDTPIMLGADEDTSKPFDEEPILDEKIITQLLEIGDKQSLSDIQQKFWSSIGNNLDLIQNERASLPTGDMGALMRFRGAVHAIKGASVNIGLNRASMIARELQNAPPKDALNLLSDLCICLKASKAILAKALG